MQVVKYSLPPETPFAIDTLAGDSSQLIEERLAGVSGWAENARRLVAIHATHDNTLNLEGEPGTGKRFIAALIHQCSARRDGPFVSLSLGSASDNLSCSVLFGSSQTSSPDDLADGRGLMELAREGTIYVEGLLNPTSSLAGHIVNLLRQSRFNNRTESQARILVGWETQPCSYRSAISNDLRNGRNFESLSIPPLRERPDDIEALAMHFVKQRCQETQRELRAVSPETLNALRSYDWPRNVLELKTLVRAMVNQTRPPVIDVSLVPAYVRDRIDSDAGFFPASGVDLGDEIRRHEIELICAALKHSRGLQAKAARLLHTKATTLFMKIQRYGIDVEVFR
ncbi:MAG TPA: sigma 54-interacting transcriptional regulator [Blastocatellia bacterium]|nr:sigma 54-interacting transcriptional regulator [Blastocatellia bacterium]